MLQKHYAAQIQTIFDETLTQQGYLPPEPFPLVRLRSLRALVQRTQSQMGDAMFANAVRDFEHRLETEHRLASGYLQSLRQNVENSFSITRAVRGLLNRFHTSIGEATVSYEIPEVEPVLRDKMRSVETFLATGWTDEARRGVLSVHVDKTRKITILQLGTAQHGPVYVTIPSLLKPEDLALRSIRELIDRASTFQTAVDPMAVINGEHQNLNYNTVFANARVIRAPSGDTDRLLRNIAVTSQRDRLSPENTVVLNSAPATLEEYGRVFPGDRSGSHWHAWGTEAQAWRSQVTKAEFSLAQEASRESMLHALSHSQNVIVIVAHCDGESIFMPAPPPDGTQVTSDYLLEHREEIAANAPFVYLFSCEAGSLRDLRNFASTLLDCGAAGVVASQSILGAPESRLMLGSILSERRGHPPLQDFYRAMIEVKYHQMEVFLA